MNERLNASSREIGTSFYDGDQIDTHVANPNLLSLEEVKRRRQRQEFAIEARRLMEQEAKPELPVTPIDRLTVMGNNLVYDFRATGLREGLPPAA